MSTTMTTFRAFYWACMLALLKSIARADPAPRRPLLSAAREAAANWSKAEPAATASVTDGVLMEALTREVEEEVVATQGRSIQAGARLISNKIRDSAAQDRASEIAELEVSLLDAKLPVFLQNVRAEKGDTSSKEAGPATAASIPDDILMEALIQEVEEEAVAMGGRGIQAGARLISKKIGGSMAQDKASDIAELEGLLLDAKLPVFAQSIPKKRAGSAVQQDEASDIAELEGSLLDAKLPVFAQSISKKRAGSAVQQDEASDIAGLEGSLLDAKLPVFVQSIKADEIVFHM